MSNNINVNLLNSSTKNSVYKNFNVSVMSPQKFYNFPDTFETSNKIIKKDKNILPIILTTVAGVGATIVGILVLIKNKRAKSAGIITNETEKFFADIRYRQNILKELNLPQSEHNRIRSVIGKEEFAKYVKEFENNPSVYTPGRKTYQPSGEVAKFDNSNIDKFEYGANFHIHTLYSDGKMTPKELTEQAIEYGNKLFEKKKKPFIFSVTDHDSVQANKEIIIDIYKNPQKYKNVRFVPGIENTTVYENPKMLTQPVKIHLLSYGINPFSKDINNFVNSKIQINIENIQKAIDAANTKMQTALIENGLSYSADELFNIIPALKYSIKPSNLLMKDYLQSRLIFANSVENNLGLKSTLEKSGIDIKKLNFWEGMEHIVKNPSYANGEKYWHYYYDGLKKYIVSEVKKHNPNADTNGIMRHFPYLSQNVTNALNDFESMCCATQSPLCVQTPKYHEFKEAVSKIAGFEDASQGIAHPGVFFDKSSLKPNVGPAKLYAEIYKLFTKFGKGSAKFSEDYYQIYFNNFSQAELAKLQEISNSASLLKTGGLDTHGNSIFQFR